MSAPRYVLKVAVSGTEDAVRLKRILDAIGYTQHALTDESLEAK